MAYVITQLCDGVCDTKCTTVCPVDCILGPVTREEVLALPEAERATRLAGVQLYIDPDECICCAACVPVCPVEAIVSEDENPVAAAINAAYFAA